MAAITLVLGMHRSGTSAVTGALSHLGLKLGSNQRLMPPSLENPLGYFELQDISHFNELLLNQRGLTWDSVSLAPLPAFDTSDISLARALVFGAEEAITCVKDPRISVLLPIWRSALLDRITNLIVLRDPREVVWSLVVRNGFTPVHASALWITYNALIAESASGLPNHLVFFDDVTERPGETMREITEFLISGGCIQGASDEQISLATKSIDPLLRQVTYPQWLSDHPLVAEAMAIYKSIKDSRSLDVISTHIESNNRRIERLCNEVIDMHRRSGSVMAEVANGRLLFGNQPIGHLSHLNLDSHNVMVEGALTAELLTQRDLAIAQRDAAIEKLEAIEASHIWRSTAWYRKFRTRKHRF
jgi:hypothetical protein